MVTEFAVSTSFIRTDVSRLERLVDLGQFRKLEIGFYDEDALPLVMDFATRRGLAYGFHDPLPRLPSDDYPFLTDPDDEKRWRTLASMYRTLQTAVHYGAEYVIGHIPSVMWEPRPALDAAQIMGLAHSSCHQLSVWSRDAGIPFILENVGPNPYFSQVDAFVEVMEAYPDLMFCLDIGHLHLMSIYSGIDALEFTTRLAAYTWVVHVYNATPEMYRKYHHIPAHPTQRPEDGWADIPAILKCVLRNSQRELRIVFEYSPQYPGDDDFVREGIEWVRNVVAGAQVTSQG
jgi:sugar phosphate isomerase/epimerase